MTLLQKARVFVGVLSAITLLTLITANFLWPDRMLTNRAIVILLMLISSTLALDIALERFPITIELGNNSNNENQ